MLDLFRRIFNLSTMRVWFPPMLGGDATLLLDDKVKALGKEIDAKREEAKVAWAEFDKIRSDLAASDEDVSDETSEGFKKAEGAHAKYGNLADELSALENRRQKLWAMTAERGQDMPVEQRKAIERVKDGLRSHESYGARIVATETYARLREAGAFSSSSALGSVRFGEAMSRDELREALANRMQAALIVSDPGADATVAPFIEPDRRGFVEPRFRKLLVTDLITVLTTDSDSIEYVVESGFTNAAAFVAEASTDAPIGDGVTAAQGGRKPQSVLTYEKRDAAVKTIAHWMAVTKKSLADVARVRSLIDTRLRRGIADVVEDQVIDGDGTGENLLGILNTTGIQHQDRGSGPLVEDILRAQTKLELAFFNVGATGLNPLDWQEIRLSRDESGGAGTGQYLFGPPSQAGATTLWGRPTVSGPQFPEDQPTIADWEVIELYVREGVQVLATDSHEDWFVRNLVAILAEMRLGLVIPQPEGICEVSPASS